MKVSDIKTTEDLRNFCIKQHISRMEPCQQCPIINSCKSDAYDEIVLKKVLRKQKLKKLLEK